MGSMLWTMFIWFLIWFMGDLKRVMKARLWIAIAAIVLFAVNLVIGTEANGSKNWINLGPISIQPSEFIKIAFIFVGASTLDKFANCKTYGDSSVFYRLSWCFDVNERLRYRLHFLPLHLLSLRSCVQAVSVPYY